MSRSPRRLAGAALLAVALGAVAAPEAHAWSWLDSSQPPTVSLQTVGCPPGTPRAGQAPLMLSRWRCGFILPPQTQP